MKIQSVTGIECGLQMDGDNEVPWNPAIGSPVVWNPVVGSSVVKREPSTNVRATLDEDGEGRQ